MKLCVALLAAAALALTGCSSSERNDPPPQTQTLAPSGVVEKPTLGFRVGAATDYSGSKGLRARVRLDATRSVVGSTTSTPAGRRLFAAHFAVTNTGRTTQTIEWGSDVLDDTRPDGGPTHPVAEVKKIDAGPLLAYPLRLAPRQTATGWVAYLMPTNRLAVAVDFLVGDGPSSVAQWAMTSQR